MNSAVRCGWPMASPSAFRLGTVFSSGLTKKSTTSTGMPAAAKRFIISEFSTLSRSVPPAKRAVSTTRSGRRAMACSTEKLSAV